MRIRFEVVALLLVVGFLAAMITLSHREDVDLRQMDGSLVVRSSFRTLPEGYKALYLTLGRLGYTVQRQVRPYALLPKRGLLIVADPAPDDEHRMTDFEKEKLAAWLAAGNHALVLFEHHPQVLFPLPEDRYATAPDGPVDFEAISHPVTPEWEIAIGKRTANATPVVPSFLAARAPALSVKTGQRFTDTDLQSLSLGGRDLGTVLLYKDTAGGVVAYSAIGKGGVVWCTSPWSFSNDGLRHGKGQNLDFVLALAQLQPDAPVIFDEYHHNIGTRMSLWTLAPPLTKLGLIELAVALLLLMVTLAWRFGPRQLPPEERFSRSRAEYLSSMAGLFERVRATHVVARRLRLRLARGLGQRLGVPANAPLARLIEANDRLALADPDLLRRVCHALDQLENEMHPDEHTVLQLARAVEELVSLKGRE